jgi:transcriptional regulator with XRE-family HTH domain
MKETKGLQRIVGRMIRARRNLAGVSQQTLANHLGVTFQQIQKYEKGDNRLNFVYWYKILDLLKSDKEEFLEEFSYLSGEPPKESTIVIEEEDYYGRLVARAFKDIKFDSTKKLVLKQIIELSKHEENLATERSSSLIEHSCA